ncbi:cation/H+ exchanger 4 [Euphorbia peplus]|nr:cation/H+ exchanger 4 [Euphorbia peplus]
MGGTEEGYRIEDFSILFPGNNETLTCIAMPPRSNSHGIVGTLTEQNHFLAYRLPLLELQLGFILFLSHAIRFLLKPFGISAFVSCMLAGIILGPNCLGKFDFTRDIIFPHEGQDIIHTAVMLGYNIYVFLAAVQMDIEMVFKTGRKALSIGIASTIVPMVIISIYQKVQQNNLAALAGGGYGLVVVGVVTSLPVVAYVINQLKLPNTELGRLALATGLVADASGTCVYFVQVLQGTKTIDEMMRKLLPLLLYILTLVFIFRPTMNWVIKRTPNKKPVNTTSIYVIMALAIGSEAYFYIIKQPQFLAPFMFGFAVPSGAPLGSALVEKFGTFTNGVLMHVLVPTAFMRADLHLLTDIANLKSCMGIISFAFVVKMVGCVAPCMILNIPIKEAVAVGLILNYTGVVQLNLASIYRDTSWFKEDVYAVMACYILLNATIFPYIIKKLYNPSRRYQGYQERNVLTIKPNTEFKILTCIYGQDNVEAYIKILEAIHPTKENPVAVCGLHLVELIGQYLPIMVSHTKNTSISTHTSQNMIYAFNKYEQNNWDSVSVQLFTGLSSFPLMHEDIVNIALEKKTSLIILPLHRRWSMRGYIESQDKHWRSVNCKVLKKAPCSVAIFFNRGGLGRKRSTRAHSSNLSVCMLFFGGSDDREALTLAKRMLKQSSSTTLTVVHVLELDCGQEIEDSGDHVYDALVLEEIKQMVATNQRLDYRTHEVQDGPGTVKIVRSMAKQFDLFLVGRRFGIQTPQTSGLSEWSELPELGVIGDLLASKDIESRASVLVVQQQNIDS